VLISMNYFPKEIGNLISDYLPPNEQKDVKFALGPPKKCSLLLQVADKVVPGYSIKLARTFGCQEGLVDDIRNNGEVRCCYCSPDTCAYAIEYFLENNLFSVISVLIVRTKDIGSGPEEINTLLRRTFNAIENHLDNVESYIFVVGSDICFNFSIVDTQDRYKALRDIMNHSSSCAE
jgi:hypothetical protein